jgi:anti-anti-sigma factor
MNRSPAFPLTWRSNLVGNAALVVVEGELDRLTTPALRDHLEWLIAWVPGRIVLDVSGVTFADVGAHVMLTDLVRAERGRRGEVVLTAPSVPMRRILAVLGTPAGVTVDRG